MDRPPSSIRFWMRARFDTFSQISLLLLLPIFLIFLPFLALCSSIMNWQIMSCLHPIRIPRRSNRMRLSLGLNGGTVLRYLMWRIQMQLLWWRREVELLWMCFPSRSSLVCGSRKQLIEDVLKNHLLTAICWTLSIWRGYRDDEYVPNVFFPFSIPIIIINSNYINYPIYIPEKSELYWTCCLIFLSNQTDCCHRLCQVNQIRHNT